MHAEKSVTVCVLYRYECEVYPPHTNTWNLKLDPRPCRIFRSAPTGSANFFCTHTYTLHSHGLQIKGGGGGNKRVLQHRHVSCEQPRTCSLQWNMFNPLPPPSPPPPPTRSVSRLISVDGQTDRQTYRQTNSQCVSVFRIRIRIQGLLKRF